MTNLIALADAAREELIDDGFINPSILLTVTRMAEIHDRLEEEELPSVSKPMFEQLQSINMADEKEAATKALERNARREELIRTVKAVANVLHLHEEADNMDSGDWFPHGRTAYVFRDTILDAPSCDPSVKKQGVTVSVVGDGLVEVCRYYGDGSGGHSSQKLKCSGVTYFDFHSCEKITTFNSGGRYKVGGVTNDLQGVVDCVVATLSKAHRVAYETELRKRIPNQKK